MLPNFCNKFVVLQCPLLTSTEKMQEKGPMIFHPYPRGIGCNHLQISKQRKHILPSYFETLTMGTGRA